jgi:uncharacterized membrane protein YczE
MKEIKRYVAMLVLIMATGIGAAFSIKAAVGVGAWDAMTQTLGFLTGIKVGTVGMAINISCVAGQFLILRKDFRLKHFLQIPLSVFLGVVVNFVLYNILGDMTFDSYAMRLAVLVSSYTLIAASVGAIMDLDVVTFALEGFCMAISGKTGMKFSHIRQLVDVICIALVLILVFTVKVPLTVREGTVIGMLMFGPLIGFFMKKSGSLFRKLNLSANCA